MVAAPYQVYVLTHSSFAVGALSLVQLVPIVLAGLYGGLLADRFDRRLVQISGKTVCAACSIGLAAGAAGMRAPVVFVYVVASIAAAAFAVEQAARSATIPRLVAPELLPSALSLTQMTYQAAMVAGPAFAGFVIATAGLARTYTLDVLTWVPVVVLLKLISPQPSLADGGVTFELGAPMHALRFVRGNRLLIALFAADLIAMTFGMPTAVFPALALSVFAYGPGVLGLLYAGPAAGALIASVLSGWVTHVEHQGRAVLWAIAVWGAAIAGFGLAGRLLWVGLPLLAVAGGADLVSTIFRGTILQLAISDAIRGRMSAFHSMVASMGPRLGDLEAGAVAALVNPTFSVVSGGVACVAGIALVAALLPEIRRQGTNVGPV